MKSLSLPVLFLALLSGCTTEIANVQKPPQDQGMPLPRETIADAQKNIAAVGEDMITGGNLILAPAKTSFLVVSMGASATSDITHKLSKISFNLYPTTLRSEGISVDGHFFRYPGVFKTSDGKLAEGGLLSSSGRVDKADKIYWKWLESKGTTYYTARLNSATNLKADKITEVVSGAEQYPVRSELIYSGILDGKIRFLYREFTVAGTLKPSFTQDVTLDYLPGTEYGFKKSRFIIHKAGPATIEYTLLHSL